MTRKSHALLALVVLLGIGCKKTAIGLGDGADAGPDSPVAGGSTDPGGSTRTGGEGSGGAAGSASTSDPGPLGGGAGGQKTSSSGWITTTILQAPERAVDILFVIDNSPSMDPKQRALAKTFPRMIEALQAVEGGMPDVRIGVISSDVGAGAGEAGGNCSGVLGNQGILWGHDPEVSSDTFNNRHATLKDFKSDGGLDGCGMNPGTRWIEDIQNADGVGRTRNYQGNLADVFSCMAKAVGVGGCGYEHTLQSLRLALNPIKEVNPQNFGFLRRKAHLAIVIVSDEDDCSADPSSDTNDGMFWPRTLGDTASLRCAARGHVCNGQAIPNYDPAMGFTSSSPFVAKFADCEAKDDVATTSAGRDYKSLPLIRIHDMIDSVKQVKDRPEEQIMVAGIIGWPENGDLNGAEYRIDKDLTSLPAEQQKLWDYMPICTRPEEKSADGNIYKAYGGFRLKKFIDGFGRNGQVYSICNSQGYADAMQMFGNALVRRLRPACISYPLVDKNPDVADLQPECRVEERVACDTPGKGACQLNGYIPSPIPECIDPITGIALSPSSPAVDHIADAGRPCWHLVYDMDPVLGCPNVPPGQKISMLRKTGAIAPTASLLAASCRAACDSASDPVCLPN